MVSDEDVMMWVVGGGRWSMWGGVDWPWWWWCLLAVLRSWRWWCLAIEPETRWVGQPEHRSFKRSGGSTITFDERKKHDSMVIGLEVVEWIVSR
ncbi:hypothetical protein Hanom_Chr12g01081201 [Helianthus anomalus]